MVVASQKSYHQRKEGSIFIPLHYVQFNKVSRPSLGAIQLSSTHWSATTLKPLTGDVKNIGQLFFSGNPCVYGDANLNLVDQQQR